MNQFIYSPYSARHFFLLKEIDVTRCCILSMQSGMLVMRAQDHTEDAAEQQLISVAVIELVDMDISARPSTSDQAPLIVNLVNHRGRPCWLSPPHLFEVSGF